MEVKGRTAHRQLHTHRFQMIYNLQSYHQPGEANSVAMDGG